MKLRLNFKLIRSLIVLAALPLVGCTSGQFRKETSGSSGGGAGKLELRRLLLASHFKRN